MGRYTSISIRDQVSVLESRKFGSSFSYLAEKKVKKSFTNSLHRRPNSHLKKKILIIHTLTSKSITKINKD